MHKKPVKLDTYLLPIAVFMVLIAIWEGLDYLLGIREIILPSPHEILFQILANWPQLLKDTTITMTEAVSGFFIGAIIGVLFAIWFVYSAKTKKALYPYAIALKATPLYALAPLLIIWFGNGYFSKIIMAALVAFFPVLVSAVKGLTSIESQYFDVLKAFSASKLQILTTLRIPNAVPDIFSGLKIATTLAVVGAVIAEFTGASAGIGHLIVNSSYYLNTSLMFAGIFMISFFGILFFYLIQFIENKVVFWQETD